MGTISSDIPKATHMLILDQERERIPADRHSRFDFIHQVRPLFLGYDHEPTIFYAKLYGDFHRDPNFEHLGELWKIAELCIDPSYPIYHDNYSNWEITEPEKVEISLDGREKPHSAITMFLVEKVEGYHTYGPISRMRIDYFVTEDGEHVRITYSSTDGADIDRIDITEFHDGSKNVAWATFRDSVRSIQIFSASLDKAEQTQQWLEVEKRGEFRWNLKNN